MNRRTWILLLVGIAAVSWVSAQELVDGHYNGCDEPAAAMALGDIENTGSGTYRAIYHSREYGDGVEAYFISVDGGTCDRGVATSVIVQGSQGIIYGNDQPIESSRVTVLVEIFDRCLNTSILSVTGTGPADQLWLDPNFKSAGLRASIQGTDHFGVPVAITVDLVWVEAGSTYHDSFHLLRKAGGFRWVSNSTGTIRCAYAAGTVTVDSRDVTPEPSPQGGIEKDSKRTLVIYRWESTGSEIPPVTRPERGVTSVAPNPGF